MENKAKIGERPLGPIDTDTAVRTDKTRAKGARRTVATVIARHGREIGLPVAVIVLVAYFAYRSEVFLTVPNFRNIGLQASALATVAFGQTAVILTAGLDLSVGAIVALVSVVTALAMLQYGVVPGVLIGAAVGILAGLVNGVIITRLRVFPFITTLATMSFMSGLALNLAGGTPVTGLPADFTGFAYERILGVPAPVVVSLAILVLTFLILRYTRVGRNIYAIGGNQEAARLSGLRVDLVKVLAYMYSGFCSVVAASILTSRVASGQPTLGATLPLESIAAVVLGGVSLFGGRGSVIGVAFGVAFVSLLSNGLNLLNVSSYTQMMVIGVALAGAVAIDQAFVRRGNVH
jgi:ribose transport system permease protein